jgi:EAL domain-containing protein (putative c-di-GMP-specific phosphodiesterase class I)
MEALLRWNHPTRGLLAPSNFLAIAERSGLILPLGEWVLDRACEQMRFWQHAGVAPATIAVNVAAAQLKSGDEFIEAVTETLRKWDLAPSDLELDVTESMLAQVTLPQSRVLDRLWKLDVKIAVDDFGGRDSALEHLRTYRVARVKIPHSLVESASYHAGDAAMVNAIIAIAQELNIDVVGQGVETQAGEAFLMSAVCAPTKAQGFYYSEPVSATRATQILRSTPVVHTG